MSRAFVLIAIIFSSAIAFSQSFTIATFAGDNTSGNFGDGGNAFAAQLNFPQSVAIDKAGDVYIADTYNNVIRELTPNGIIQIIAGNYTRGYSGDGGPAVNAQLSYPTGVAVDSSGNVYIADSSNDVIRQVTPGGNIITAAGNNTRGYSGDGGAANAAQLYDPYSVVLDSSGNLYISDSSNHAIREVLASSGVIATLGGNGGAGYSGDGGPAVNAQFNYPLGLAMDPSGNLYVADFGNNVIRKIAANSGVVTTVAGTAAAGFLGDGSSAINAELAYPESVAVDTAGNLYIADTLNQRIRQVSLNGNIQTIAGDGQAGYSGDGGPALNARFFYPKGVAVNPAGAVYVVDWENNVVRLLTPSATGHDRHDRPPTQ